MLRFSLRRQYPIVPLSSKLSKPKFERITPEPRARKNQDPNQIYLYPSNASMHERLRSPICNMFTKARLHTASMHFLTLIDLTILPSYLGNTKKIIPKIHTVNTGRLKIALHQTADTGPYGRNASSNIERKRFVICAAPEQCNLDQRQVK